MAVAGISRTPWLGCFSIADTNPHRLLDLLTSLPAAQQPLLSAGPGYARCQFLVLGNDINNGGAKLYVGNENLSLTFFGARIPAANFLPFYSMDANLIRVDQIWIMFDVQPAIVTLEMLTR